MTGEAESDIYDVSAWILRGGVLLSVATMLCGLSESFREGGVSLMLVKNRRFTGDIRAIVHGAARWDGVAVIELGVLILVLTPVMRVAAATALFARERDWLYTAISATVLALTLSALFWAH